MASCLPLKERKRVDEIDLSMKWKYAGIPFTEYRRCILRRKQLGRNLALGEANRPLQKKKQTSVRSLGLFLTDL